MVAEIKGPNNSFGWCGTGVATTTSRAVEALKPALEKIQSRMTCDINVLDAVDVSTLVATRTSVIMSLKGQAKNYPLEGVKERVESLLQNLGFAGLKVIVVKAADETSPTQQKPGKGDAGDRGVTTMAIRFDPITGRSSNF